MYKYYRIPCCVQIFKHVFCRQDSEVLSKYWQSACASTIDSHCAISSWNTWSAGEWGSGDDRRLLRALLESGAKQEFQVDWADVVKGRSASICSRRWRLMVKQVPEYFESAFCDSVMYLTRTKCPRLLKPKGEQPPAESRSSEALAEET